MRIIAGKHRGKPLLSPRDKGIRPTSSKSREALFNILSNLQVVENARVLDLCCGTGALGLEALSRGASHVIFIDGSAEHLKLAAQNIHYLQEQNQSTLLRANAENLPQSVEELDLVFIDPPYFKKVADKALVSLVAKKWLKNNAIVVVELAKTEDLVFSSAEFQEIDKRIYGNSKFILLERI